MLGEKVIAQEANAVNDCLLFVLDQCAQKPHIRRRESLSISVAYRKEVRKAAMSESDGLACMQTD